MYTPSPGSIYPTLQMLEDRGFVTVSEVDAKKVYSITDAGRAFLAEEQQRAGEPSDWRGFPYGNEAEWAEMAALWQELHASRHLLGRAWHSARRDPEKLKRLRNLLERVRAELAEIAGGSD
jgi:DNA-binding PadR family transcriptional regulator